jgi:hypothetical protein
VNWVDDLVRNRGLLRGRLSMQDRKFVSKFTKSGFEMMTCHRGSIYAKKDRLISELAH